MVSKKSGDITRADDTESGGEVGGQVSEDSYVQILNQLGVDTQAMSLDEVRQMIQQYSEEGAIKGAKVIDLKTGKSVQTFKSKKEQGRTISVKKSSDEPLTRAEMEQQKKDEDYRKGSDKEDTPAPGKPFSPPKMTR